MQNSFMELHTESKSNTQPPTFIFSNEVLIVDDEPLILSTFSRVLKKAGYDPVVANNGKEAIHCLENHSFAAIISDINMPMMGGMDFLKNVRRNDLDVPVLLITGDPSIKTAADAIEFGAYRYLLKPVQTKDLLDSLGHAIRMHKMAKLKREALSLLGSDPTLALGDKASLEIHFNHALETFWLALQPIVIFQEKKIYAYEALARSDEAQLQYPNTLLLAAERLNRSHELGRLIRQKAFDIMKKADDDLQLFVNLQPTDLNDDDLYDSRSPLSDFADRIVLEITERSSLDEVKDLGHRVAKLRRIGYRIAIDDLGAGYAGLTSFTQLDPEIVKLDMSLIHNIDSQRKKQSIVRSMSKLAKELGITIVAEGIETESERDMVIHLGCDLLQGYLFSKPARGFCSLRF